MRRNFSLSQERMRSEQEIFDELGELCVEPGFAHAVAFLSFRDNFVRYRDKFNAKDYLKMFSFERLIRTELSTLIGLMVRVTRDLTLPAPEKLNEHIQKAEHLLGELHQAMMAPMFGEMQTALQGAARDTAANPFTTAAAMREPIFYGAESAYSFQY